MKKIGSILIIEESDILFNKKSFTKILNEEGLLNRRLINQIWKPRPSNRLDETALREMVRSTVAKDPEYCKLIIPWWKFWFPVISVVFAILMLLIGFIHLIHPWISIKLK